MGNVLRKKRRKKPKLIKLNSLTLVPTLFRRNITTNVIKIYHFTSGDHYILPASGDWQKVFHEIQRQTSKENLFEPTIIKIWYHPDTKIIYLAKMEEKIYNIGQISSSNENGYFI